jgi:hypothetical protein
LNDLFGQIADHPIDLFDHRLSEDFYLRSNLNSRDQTAPNGAAGQSNSSGVGYAFTKSAVTATGTNAAYGIPGVYDPIVPLNPRNKLLGQLQRVKVFGQAICYRIAEARASVTVFHPVEQSLKAIQQKVRHALIL